MRCSAFSGIFLPRNPLFLILVQIFSGFLWSGCNLCASNFIYDAATPEKRPKCIAYFNALNGVFLAAGHFWEASWSEYFQVFLVTRSWRFFISAVLRFLVACFMRTHVEEVRHVEKISHKDLFYGMINIKPVLGIERKTIKY
jgi:MFS family permease